MNVQAHPVTPPGRVPATPAGGRRGLDFQAVADLVVRRWPIVAISTVLVTVAMVAAALLMTPRYQAQVRLRINPQANAPSAAFDADRNATQPDQTIVDTEVSVMRSHDIAEAVARRLNLAADPAFNPDATAGQPPLRPDQPVPQPVYEALAGGMTVTREPGTYIVDIAFQSTDPVKAAAIANAFAAAYAQASVERSTGKAARTSKWLDQRLQALGAEVRAADAKVADYRARAGIVQGATNGTITDQQVAPLATELSTAEAQAAADRAKLSAAQAQIRRGGLDSVSSVLTSTTISDLRSQRTQVLRDKEEVAAKYGPKHPEYQRVQQQLDGIDHAIDQEARRIVGSLAAQSRASEASAASLRGAMSRLRSQQGSDTQAAVTADSLQRQADAKRTVYQQLAQAANQSSQEKGNDEPQGVIIERAAVPAQPSSPNKPLFVVAGLVLGAMIGLAIIFLIELLSTGVRTVDDVEQGLGIPFLSSLPLLSPRRLKTKEGHEMTPADYVLAKPMSTYAEALRTIRSSLVLNRPERPRVISIVSAVPGEGKTSTVAALGRVMAMAGDRIIIVDCDLRRGGLGILTQGEQETGLLEVLAGAVPLDRAIVHDKVDGLDVLPLARSAFTPKDVFSGPEMQALLAELVKRYDTVVLDTPPLLAVADARTLAGMSDVVTMVIHWQYTPRRAIRSALALLEQDGTAVSGAVLSMTSTKARSVGADNPAYYYAMYRQYHEA